MGKFLSKLDREGTPIALTLETTQTMLAAWDPTCRVERLELLTGGLRNTNYKVMLDNCPNPVVLRLCPANLVTFKKEIALLRHIYPKILAPVPLFTNFTAQHPYALVSYIPGDTLDNLWEQLSSAELLDLFTQLGEIASRIHSIRFTEAGYLDENLEVTQPLYNFGEYYFELIFPLFENLSRSNQPELDFVQPLLKVLQVHKTAFTDLPITNRLVHGDFNPKNIMIYRENHRWTVSGIIDWEFGFSASPLLDIGNFLRFEDEMPPGARDAFVTGYLSAGGNLPSEWLILSLMLDLAVMGEFLSQPLAKPRTFQTAVQVCRRVVAAIC